MWKTWIINSKCELKTNRKIMSTRETIQENRIKKNFIQFVPSYRLLQPSRLSIITVFENHPKMSHLTFQNTFYKFCQSRQNQFERTLYSAHALFSARLIEHTLNRAHALLIALLIERTLNWAHTELSARWIERTLDWAHAELSTRWIERTLNWAHPLS